MDKVLILGGTRFFGKRLTAKLLSQGSEVTIATRGITPDPFGDTVRRIVLDREDPDGMHKGLANGEWDVVYDQTCYAPGELADALRILKGKTKRYVFTSTMAVYDHGQQKAESDFDPNTVPYTLGKRRDYVGMEGYTRAKREAEALLFDQATVPAAAIRFPIVIGPDDYTLRLRFYVERVMSGTPIGVRDPNIRLSFISSEEAADFLYWAGKSDWTGPMNGASIGDVSHREIMTCIEKVAGTKGSFIANAERDNVSPYDLPGSWTLDASKAAGLGFTFKWLSDYMPELIASYVQAVIRSGRE